MTLDLVDVARRWMAEDPDPATRAETAALLDDPKRLAALFGKRLEFGTAGLRGPIAPGPGGMNRANVRRVTAGLAAVLMADGGGTVVVGYDGRRNSRVFAEDTARVLCGAGLDVALFDGVCPTPSLAYAVTWLGACGGVMITASHNPPADNGYKVYAADGAQIVPPLDGRISDAIDAVGSLAEVAVPELAALQTAGRVRSVPPGAWQDYFDAVRALRVHPDDGLRAGLKVVYTAMHGVGSAAVRAMLAGTGHQLVEVAEQAEPDGAFPTVAFPNPEEKGAMDLAIARATAVGADLIVANDPDADRLAVAVPDGAGWRQLTGNEVGCLLAEDLLAIGPGGRRMVANSLVSSTLLARIAEAHDAAYAETLTGFKWIAHAAMPFDAAGGRFVLGYEEALGYSAGSVVRDKDGVSAVLLICDLAAACKNRGQTLLDALESLARRYGVYASRQLSLTLPGAEGAARIQGLMSGLRANRPSAIAGIGVRSAADLLAGTRVERDGSTSPVALPPSDVLAWTLDDGSRVLARPSGTEPKIKFYFEVVEPMRPSDRLADGEARAAVRMDALVAGLRALAGV